MHGNALIGFTVIVGLGMGAQWLAWRLRLPSILLLLTFGFFAGPDWTGLLDPDALFGDLLLPIVELSAALILFEGGLSLNLRELGRLGPVVTRLVTVGVLLTWVLGSVAAVYLLPISTPMAWLLGAILTVSGPTVVLPLLRHVRPHGPSGTVLKWEGIVVDPIGASLAVIVFEAVLVGSLGEAAPQIAPRILMMILVGVVLGVATAWLLVQALRRYWLPDHLHNPMALSLVVAAFAASNAIQADSGLLTVTILGVALANQVDVGVRHIIEFKENLRVLLISSIFILLAARLGLDDLAMVDLGAVAFLLALVLVIRPIVTIACTWGSRLSAAERVFVAWMFPRGIVAAAVASVFALRLDSAGIEGASTLVPLTFLVIIGTVTIYGLTAEPLARRLGLATPNPQGVLMVGAHAWGREIARALQEVGIEVLMADSNRRNVVAARMQGFTTWYGNALAEYADEEMNLTEIGHCLALTPNDEVNILTSAHYVHQFGREKTFRLARQADGKEKAGEEESRPATTFQGRILFGRQAHFSALASRFGQGARVKATNITEQFDYEAWQEEHGDRALPLFAITEGGQLRVATVEKPLRPEAGQILLALLSPEPRSEPPPAPGTAAASRGGDAG